jgi:GNAT superfamily N-acetyltransferase
MTDDAFDLARAADAAQSILATPAAVEARHLERAFARAAARAAEALARLDPSSGAGVLDVAGGVAIQAGRGSPLTQALALGLGGPVTAAELDAAEAQLCPDGTGTRQLELCPFVDPSLPALLAARGYRVHEWQLAWTRAVPDAALDPPPSSITVRRARPGEEDSYARLLLRAFLETDAVPQAAVALVRPTGFAEGYELYFACLDGEPVGGGTLAVVDGVALINGSGVLPAFRGRGAQGALIRARLDRARALGCTRAYSCTQPGTASRRNMERHGFHVAYPKILMLRE